MNHVDQGPLIPRQRILFVCTGNTCRSPMAEVILRGIIAKLDLDPMEVRSAGVHTANGLQASDGARNAARRHGLSLEDHRSKVLTQEMVDWADWVFVMGPGHLPMVELFGGGGKAHLLGAFAEGMDQEESRMEPAPVTVPDPFGGDDALYDKTFRILERYVETALKRLGEVEKA